MTPAASDRIPAHLIEPEEPIRDPAGHAPVRRPNSVRRTSSLDAVWPGNDFATDMHFTGRARDVHTGPKGGTPDVLMEDRLTVRISRDRVIQAIESSPHREYVKALVGVKGGGRLREALNQALPDPAEGEAPLYLLIDDLAGSSLVAIWAWTQWVDMWSDNFGHKKPERSEQLPTMEGVCIGFRPGASSLDTDGKPRITQNASPVLPLQNPEDPEGWHPLPEPGGVHFRRARRIDVWRDGDLIRIDSGFQDSANTPEGGRTAIHEYTVTATADAKTLELLEVDATPGTLPYTSCPAATGEIHRLIGTPLHQLRHRVLEHLAGVKGCTHLNDALRALAEVPVLLRELDARSHGEGARR